MSAFESVDADVNIVLNAEDNASDEIQNATRKINREWTNMRNQQRAVERQFEINNRTLVQTSRVLGRIGNTIGRLRSIYNTFLLQQIRNAQLTNNLNDAQTNLNDTIAEYGINSREATDAQKALDKALEDSKPKIEDQIVQWTSYAESILIAGLAITSLVPKLRGMKLPKTPTASKAPIGGAGASAGIGSKVGSGILKNAGRFAGRLAGGGIGAGLAIVSDIQPAGEDPANPLPSGIDAIAPLADAINVNIIAPTSEEIIRGVNEAKKQLETFLGGG